MTEVMVELTEQVWVRLAQGVKPTVGIFIEGVEDIVRNVLTLEVESMASTQISLEFLEKDIHLDKRHLLTLELRGRLGLGLDSRDRCTPSTD